MKSVRISKIPAIIIVAASLGMVLLRVWDIRRLFSPVYTMDMSDDVIRLSKLSGVLDALLGTAGLALGVATWRGRRWARNALFVLAGLWAALFTVGTSATLIYFDLRLESYAFSLCLALYYLSTGFLLWAARGAINEKDTAVSC
ncbi:MAG: hypothetical protein ABSB82_08150 [Terriglobia bacterium]|jgi:hypothetical protein